MKTQPAPTPRESTRRTLKPIKLGTTTRLLLAVCLLCLFPALTRAETAVQAWVQRYNGPGNGDDGANAMAVDGSNNVIVTGSSTGSGTYSHYATIKYSSAGVPLWTNRYNGPGNGDDGANAVAVDGSNNVIVTGGSVGYGTSYDFATIEYSSDGVPLWTNRYNAPANLDDVAYAVAVDGGNNVIVTGIPATIKYSSAGLPLWTNYYGSIALAVDGSNNVIIMGAIKYSSAGVPLWTNIDVGHYLFDLFDMAVDHSGNVIVTGQSWNGTNYDFATIKYICVPSPVMTGLQATSGSVQLRVDQVLQPGTLVIEASTNLAGWAPVFTNTTPTNVLFYTDPDAGSNLWRFYRAFQFP